jgi:predicted nucleic acid-binding protein
MYDEGDIEAYQKLSKVYNDIRKTAKFTAAQNKETKEDFVDCVGNLVAYCEKEGGKIPRH